MREDEGWNDSQQWPRVGLKQGVVVCLSVLLPVAVCCQVKILTANRDRMMMK